MPTGPTPRKILSIMNASSATAAAAGPDPRRFSRPSHDLKVLLLEGIHDNAVKVLRDAGFENVETHATALTEADLMERVRGAHYLGIRSRSSISAEVLALKYTC